MAVFVVMVPEDLDPEKAVLVRDGFQAGAFLLPFAWLLFHRLWLESLAAFLLMLVAGSMMTGLSDQAFLGTAASLLIGLYFGLEASALQIGALRRRGYTMWGTVEAANAKEAEIRYATAVGEPTQLLDLDLPWSAPQPISTPIYRPATPGTLGLVSYPWKP